MSLADDYMAALSRFGVMNYGSLEASGEANFLRRYLGGRAAPVVFDVGAHVGEYALYAAGVAPTVIIHAFEPHPVTVARLRTAVAGSARIHAWHCAMGEQAGLLTLYDHGARDGSHYASLHRDVLAHTGNGPVSMAEVQVRTVDEVAAELAVERIDLLKIDTEGHELPVLRGATALLAAHRIDAIQFEFNEACIATRVFFKDFWDLLSGFGYRFFRLLPNGALYIPTYEPAFCEIFAFQNIVCLAPHETWPAG